MFFPLILLQPGRLAVTVNVTFQEHILLSDLKISNIQHSSKVVSGSHIAPNASEGILEEAVFHKQEK